MPRSRTPDLTLDSLKKEAKRWLKALRGHDAGRARAIRTGRPDRASKTPTLRDVQLALAREFGLPGWTALKQTLAARSAPTGPVRHRRPKLSHGSSTTPAPIITCAAGRITFAPQHTAMRLLDRYPEIATRQLLHRSRVRRSRRGQPRAGGRPGWATRTNGEPGSLRTDAGGEDDLVKRDWGSKGWEPLSYLCFTRLPLQAVDDNAVAIARALLDHGADPNVYFMAGDSHYTPLVGAIGEGEEGRPRASSSATRSSGCCSIEAPSPYDEPGHLQHPFQRQGPVVPRHDLRHSRRLGRGADWADPEWQMLDMGGYGSGARWHLDVAVEHNDLELAEWCLAHGANPNAPPGPRRRLGNVRSTTKPSSAAHAELAELLVRHGASASTLALDPIAGARRRLPRDRTQARSATRSPGTRSSCDASEPLFAAAEYNRRDAAELLLDLGTSPDVESREGERALHIAGVSRQHRRRRAPDRARRRSRSDRPQVRQHAARRCDALPVAPMIDLLARHSRSAWEVGYAGHVDRLRELLAEKPERARGYDGETLLMWLPPDDESKAMEVAHAAARARRRSTRPRSAGHDRGGSRGAERDVRRRGAAQASSIPKRRYPISTRARATSFGSSVRTGAAQGYTRCRPESVPRGMPGD